MTGESSEGAVTQGAPQPAVTRSEQRPPGETAPVTTRTIPHVLPHHGGVTPPPASPEGSHAQQEGVQEGVPKTPEQMRQAFAALPREELEKMRLEAKEATPEGVVEASNNGLNSREHAKVLLEFLYPDLDPKKREELILKFPTEEEVRKKQAELTPEDRAAQAEMRRSAGEIAREADKVLHMPAHTDEEKKAKEAATKELQGKLEKIRKNEGKGGEIWAGIGKGALNGLAGAVLLFMVLCLMYGGSNK